MKLKSVCFLLFLSVFASCILAQERAVFPIYPGATISSISPFFDQTIYAVISTNDKTEKVGEWYLSSLKQAGWKIEEEDVGEYDDSWFISVSHKSYNLKAELNTNITGNTLTVMIMLQGEGVHKEIFGGQAPAIGRIVDGKLVDDEGIPLDATVALPEELESYFALSDDLFRLLDEFCLEPSLEKAQQIVEKIDVYMSASEVAGYMLSDRTLSQDNSFAASAYIYGSQMDFQIGFICFFLETAINEPDRLDELAGQVCKMKNSLQNEQMPRMKELAQAAEELSKELENYGYWNDFAEVALLTDDFAIEVGEAPPEYSTKLTVTRIFTPSREFWAERLRETLINLRNWNAGCPEGDQNVDTDGDGWDDNLDCKAFGLIPFDDEIRHCLGLPRTEEREIEFLSDPMTVYCMVALAVEVGNYEQLLSDGELRVWVNNEPLMTVVLPADNLKRASVNPWDYQINLGIQGFSNPMETFAGPFLNGVRLVYGYEAADYYRAAYRYPASVSEATGGEFNGFVYFLHIGEPIILLAEDPNDGVILLSGSKDDMATQYLKFMNLARKNHPALEKVNRIRIQAVVGGVPGNIVEFTIPAVFSNLPEQVGTWEGWPSERPVSEWNFGEELGETPLPDVEPIIEITPGSGMAMLEENKRYAVLCMLHVLEHWIKMVQEMTIEAVVKKATSTENMPTPGSNAFLKCFGETSGGKYITSVVNNLKNWYPQHASAAVSEYFGKTLLNFTGEYMGKTIDVVTGKTLFQTGKQLAQQIDIMQDVTFRGLTTEAKMRISHHRYLMWKMANLANIELKLWRDIDKPLKEVLGVFEEIVGKEAAAYLTQPVNWFRRSVYGLDAIHHLYTIYKIQVELYNIERILMDMGSWISM